MMGGRHFTILNRKIGKLLANYIQNSIGLAVNRHTKRVAKAIKDIYIVDNVEIPLSLVECGFLSNPNEATLLMDDSYQNKLAYGIFLGIADYFENQS